MKRPHVMRLLDRLMDETKIKHTTLSEGEQKWRELTHHYINLWAYEVGLPFHTLDLLSLILRARLLASIG